MKSAIFIFVLLTSTLSFAQETSLKDTMAAMGEEFKILFTAIQQSQLTEREVVAAESLQKLSTQALTIYPFSADTEAQKLSYTELMAQIVSKTLELEDKLEEALANDPTQVIEVRNILVEINQLRQQGHNEFKLD